MKLGGSSPALRVLKNSAALSLSVLFERGVAFLLPWYVARVDGPGSWGQYSTALSFVALSSAFGFWGLDQLLPREVARDRPNSGPLLLAASFVAGTASILTACVAVITVGLLDYPHATQQLIWTGIVLVLLPRAEVAMCEATISGLEQMEWIAAVRLPVTVLRVALSVLLLSNGFGLEILFVVLSSSQLVVWGLYLIVLARGVAAFHLEFDWSLVPILFVQALPFVATISIGETFKHMDRVFLSKLWDTDSVGIYATGIMLVQATYLFAPAIMNALFPVLSRAYLASRRRFSMLVAQLFKFLLVSTFPIALGIIAFSRPFILVVFGENYAPSVGVLRICAAAIAPAFGARLLYRALLASESEHLAIRVAAVKSISSLVLNALLIPTFGVTGAAVSATSTEFLGLAQNLLFLSRADIQLDLRSALLGPTMCVSGSVLTYLGFSRWSPALAWVIAVGVFAGLLYLSGTLTCADWAAVFGLRDKALVHEREDRP